MTELLHFIDMFTFKAPGGEIQRNCEFHFSFISCFIVFMTFFLMLICFLYLVSYNDIHFGEMHLNLWLHYMHSFLIETQIPRIKFKITLIFMNS